MPVMAVDLEMLCVSLLARVDQLGAELHDPRTAAPRREAIRRECRALYDALVALHDAPPPDE